VWKATAGIENKAPSENQEEFSLLFFIQASKKKTLLKYDILKNAKICQKINVP